MLIEISGLRKSYQIDDGKEQPVLRGLSFSIDRGELTALVGESGSGKSTLLNIIGGLDSDFDGDVTISGKNLKKYSQKELDDYRKLKVGFIFQSFHLIPAYTVLENILTPADMTNMPEKRKKEKARALMEKLGISELQNKRPACLSGGEKQRVAIARALMNDPDLLLADEPTGALDKDNAANIISLLREIAAEGKTVLVVTHSTAVAGHCDRVIRMEYGVIGEDSGTKGTKIEKEEEKKKKLSSRKLGYVLSLSAAFRNILRNKTRNILVSLGTGIGIFSVVILLFISKGIGGYVEEQMYAGNDPLRIEVTKPSGSGGRLGSLAHSEPFSESELARIAEIEGVASLEKGSNLTGAASFSVGELNGNLAVLSTVNANFTPDIKTGAMPSTGEILINEAVANAIAADIHSLLGTALSLQIEDGDLLLTKDFVISGIIENNGTVADRFRTAYIRFDDLSAVYGTRSPPVSTVYTTAKSQSAAADIKSELSLLGFSSGSRDAALDRILSFIRMITVGLTGIAAVSLVVSGIMILVVLFISVVERTREIGILRAIGARASDIRRVFMMEGALLGLGSGLVGVAMAVLLGLAANFIIMRRLGAGIISVNVQHMLDGILIGLGVSIPASLIPAAKASKLDPVESLRHE